MSFNAQSVLNKLTDIEAMLLDFDPHATLITETWLHSDIQDNEVIPPTHKIYRNDRPSRGGGVAIVLKSELGACLLPGIPNHESLWCLVDFYGNSVVLGVQTA